MKLGARAQGWSIAARPPTTASRPVLVSRCLPLLTLLLLSLAGCEQSTSSCQTAADCDAAQHCMVDHDRGVGRCVATPGRDVEPPPLRWFADPGRTDVLLIVDDGPGTAALQARLIASLGALVERARLRHDDVRVAVTTADVISPICDPGHQTASSGALATSSCLDRLDDFIGPDGTDARWLCTDVCTSTSEQLGLDADHPWIDLLRLPPNVDPVEALACLVPQGISGCEYAAPLEALHAAFERGLGGGPRDWLRLDDLAQVVVVTDGVDCSVTPEGIAAFDPEGERTLWSDPEAAAPTAAVCWNAGVECEGDPDGFEDCFAVDRGIDGVPTDADPVLVPLATYEDEQPWLALLYELHAIVGVPVDDPGAIEYSAAGDPAWLLAHGIDPGCTDDELTAVPPVRLRDLASNVSSVCAPEYDATIGGLPRGSTICLLPCEADALAEIIYEPVEGVLRTISTCSGEYPDLRPSQGAPACWHMETDSPNCSHGPPGTVELRLYAAAPEQTGAFLLRPNIYSPQVELSGCGD